MDAAGNPLGAAGLIFPVGYVTLSFLGWLLWFSLTNGGAADPNPMLGVIARTAEYKAEYSHYGVIGWCSAIGKGVLCNWLVSLGSVMSKSTRSTAGRVLLMRIPIGTFFALVSNTRW